MSSSDDSNRHPWKRFAWKTRGELSEALISLPESYPKQRMLAPSDIHEYAEKLLFEYLSVFEPKKPELGAGDDEPGLWTEPIVNLNRPVSGTVRLQQTELLNNGHSDAQLLQSAFPQLRTDKQVLSLDALEEWELGRQVSVRLVGWTPHQGRQERTISETVHLPVAAIAAVRRQLDNCLEEIGWLPKVRSTGVIRGFDQSDGEPKSEYEKTQYGGAPDL